MKKRTLDEFVAAIDDKIQQKLGLSVHDLPDFAFFDYFSDGDEISDNDWNTCVDECTHAILEEAGWDFDAEDEE